MLAFLVTVLYAYVWTYYQVNRALRYLINEASKDDYQQLANDKQFFQERRAKS